MHSSDSGRLVGGGDVCRGGCTPPHCGQTDTCKNITFAKLRLRTVVIGLVFVPNSGVDAACLGNPGSTTEHSHKN